MGHEGHSGPVGIERAQSRGEPRHPPRGVRGSVKRVHHHEDGPICPFEPTLLREDPNRTAAQYSECGDIGVEVGDVLPSPESRQTPVLHRSERRRHRIGGVMEQLQQRLVGHG
jgi:hypothetical protein